MEFEAQVKGGEAAKLNYIVKCMPMNETRIKWLLDVRAKKLFKAKKTFLKGIFLRYYTTQSGVFEVESIMYGHIVPELQRLEPRISAPKTYYYEPTEKEGILVMENLKEQGFGLIDKVKGLTYRELELVLGQLALLHGASHHYLQNYPGGMPAFKKEYPVCH